MLLREKNVKWGNWLFRYRSYLPLVFLLLIGLSFQERAYLFDSHAQDVQWELLCLGISMFGLCIRSYTIAHTPKGTSGRNTQGQIADTLNVTGIYSTTRNPLYVGNFLMMLGVVMFFADWKLIGLFILSFWIYYEKIISAEEDFLTFKFGDSYLSYSKQTPAFFPSFKNWEKPELNFSLKNILKREYSGFFAVILCFTVFELGLNYLIIGEIYLEPIWQVLFGMGVGSYFVLRTLKRKTRFLHVKGR